MVVTRRKVENHGNQLGVFLLLHGIEDIRTDLIVLNAGKQLPQAVILAFQEETLVGLHLAHGQNLGVTGGDEDVLSGIERSRLHASSEELAQSVEIDELLDHVFCLDMIKVRVGSVKVRTKHEGDMELREVTGLDKRSTKRDMVRLGECRIVYSL